MVSWFPDEGLQVLENEWLSLYPNAVVYDIGDTNHSTNPSVSQHAPDKGTSGNPGDTKGEVDAKDFMPGRGVTDESLRLLFDGLHESRDPRILYVIYEDKIFSSVTSPWVIRDYNGKFHTHVHVSVNDKFFKNISDWSWERIMLDRWEYKSVEGARLPSKLSYGLEDEDFDGWNHISRVQALLQVLDKTLPPLDLDGVYGAKTVQKVKKVFGGSGKTLTFENLKVLHGLN
jgi:hypothetical protein